MATETIEIRTYIDNFTHFQGNPPEFYSHNEKIEIGRKHLFDFDYPIFDEDYRKVFETNFIREFYMREIGFETMGLFKIRLEHWLNINMPYFNKLYESELLEFDPLSNSEMNVTHNKTNDKQQSDSKDITKESTEHEEFENNSNQTGNTTGTTNTNSSTQTEQNDDNFNRKLESDTPDGRLAITTEDGEGVIEYASKIEEQSTNNKSNIDSTQNTTDTSNVDSSNDIENRGTSDNAKQGSQNETLVSDINEVEDFIQHRVGKIGVQTYSKMLMEFRQSFLRIDKMIFDEMQELFLLVYDF